LQQLSGLHTLALFNKDVEVLATTLESVGQMTRLSELDLHADCHVEVLLQQLTGLRQLTKLDCLGSLEFQPSDVHMQHVSSYLIACMSSCCMVHA
jgi:hypothetical protein